MFNSNDFDVNGRPYLMWNSLCRSWGFFKRFTTIIKTKWKANGKGNHFTNKRRKKKTNRSRVSHNISPANVLSLIHLPWLAFLPADAREYWVLIHKCAFIFIQLSMSSCFCTKSCRFFSVDALPLQRSLEINYVKYIRILCIFFCDGILRI